MRLSCRSTGTAIWHAYELQHCLFTLFRLPEMIGRLSAGCTSHAASCCLPAAELDSAEEAPDVEMGVDGTATAPAGTREADAVSALVRSLQVLCKAFG